MVSFEQVELTLLKYFKIGLLLILWIGSFVETNKTKDEIKSHRRIVRRFDIYKNIPVRAGETIHTLEIPLTTVCKIGLYEKYVSDNPKLEFIELRKESDVYLFLFEVSRTLSEYLKPLCNPNDCGFSKQNHPNVLRDLFETNGLLIPPRTLVLQPCRSSSPEKLIVGPLILSNAIHLPAKVSIAALLASITRTTKKEQPTTTARSTTKSSPETTTKATKPKLKDCSTKMNKKDASRLIKDPLSKDEWMAALAKYKTDRQSCFSNLETFENCLCSVNFEFQLWACKEQYKKANDILIYGDLEHFQIGLKYFSEVFSFCSSFSWTIGAQDRVNNLYEQVKKTYT